MACVDLLRRLVLKRRYRDRLAIGTDFMFSAKVLRPNIELIALSKTLGLELNAWISWMRGLVYAMLKARLAVSGPVYAWTGFVCLVWIDVELAGKV